MEVISNRDNPVPLIFNTIHQRWLSGGVIYIYIHVPDVHFLNVAAVSEGLKRLMRPLSTSITSGGSLAIALKALTWLDRPVADPLSFCTAIGDLSGHRDFDWFAYTLGLVSGLIIYALLELILALRWALVTWASQRAVQTEKVERPLYRLR